MNNLTQWKNEVLIPSLYENIDRILPELQFKRVSDKWLSPYKVDGSNPKKNRPDKTVITEKYPALMYEQGEGSTSIIDYLMNNRDKDFVELCKELAQELSLDIPKGDYSPQEAKKNELKRQILEKAQELFKSNLVEEVDKGSKDCLKYLTDKRGYKKDKIYKMDLGYITSQKATIDSLSLDSNIPNIKETIKEVLGFTDTRIGDSHSLVIPFVSGGVIRYFKYRAINKEEPKYLNTRGLSKEILFNISALSRAKDIVIVEGELDALNCTVEGIKDVVALAGKSINDNVINDLKKRNIRRVTLCLDAGEEEGTLKATELLLKHNIEPFIVELPTGDPDNYINSYGADKLNQLIEEALPFYEYWLRNKYIFKDKLKPKEADSIIEDIIAYSSSINNPTTKDKFVNFLENNNYLQQLGIGKESVEARVKDIAYNKQAEESRIKAEKLLKDSQELIKQGKPSEALESLKNGINKIQIKSNEEQFNELLKPFSEEEIKAEFERRAGDLITSFIIGGEPLTFPAGGLSYLVAPTNHGKTTFLNSIALDVIDKKKVYLFGYEESKADITVNLLSNYCNEEYSNSNKQTIKSYYKEGTNKYFSKKFESFKQKKDKFYRDLIEAQRLNIIEANLDSTQLTTFIKYIAEKGEEAVILIDYIQLITLPPEDKKRYNSRQEELKEICLRLLNTAKETGLPIILNAQFNREVDNPLKLNLKHISEAGDIERQASQVIGLFNLSKKMNYKEAEEKRIKELLGIESNLSNAAGLYAEVLKSRISKTGDSTVFGFNGNIGRVYNEQDKKLTTTNSNYQKTSF